MERTFYRYICLIRHRPITCRPHNFYRGRVKTTFFYLMKKFVGQNFSAHFSTFSLVLLKRYFFLRDGKKNHFQFKKELPNALKILKKKKIKIWNLMMRIWIMNQYLNKWTLVVYVFCTCFWKHKCWSKMKLRISDLPTYESIESKIY